MLCTDCKERSAIEIHTLCWLCLSKRPCVREPRDFTPAPHSITRGDMEFRTKREAEQELSRQVSAAEAEERYALTCPRNSPQQARAIQRRDSKMLKAARIRDLLPGLPDSDAEKRCPKHHITLLLGACQHCESEAEGLWVGRKTLPEDFAN